MGIRFGFRRRPDSHLTVGTRSLRLIVHRRSSVASTQIVSEETMGWALIGKRKP